MNTVMVKKKECTIHLTKMPEHIFEKVEAINKREFRNSNREVAMLLLAAALNQFDKSGCPTLTEFLKKSGVQPDSF